MPTFDQDPAPTPTDPLKPGDSYVQSFRPGAGGAAQLRRGGAGTDPHRDRRTRGTDPAPARARILLTLQTLGYVEQEGRQFRLTPKVLELGFAYLSAQPWWHQAQPLMEELTQQTRESTSASVLDGDQIVYMVRVPAQKIMSINLGIGSRLPAHCTSMGRVLLASLTEDERTRRVQAMDLEPMTPKTTIDAGKLLRTLAQVRRQGWALVNEELELGLMSLAVPLRDHAGRVVAAINVSSRPQQQSAAEMQRRYLPLLQGVAERLGSLLPH